MPLWNATNRLPWSTEEQDITIRVLNLKPAKTIVGILEQHAEGFSMIGKFDGERFRAMTRPTFDLTIRQESTDYFSQL